MDLKDASTITRVDAAMRAMAKVTKRLRQLEHDELSAFAEYQAAQEACKQEGLTFDLELSPGLQASYSAWKHRGAMHDARELSRAAWRDAHDAVAEA